MARVRHPIQNGDGSVQRADVGERRPMAVHRMPSGTQHVSRPVRYGRGCSPAAGGLEPRAPDEVGTHHWNNSRRGRDRAAGCTRKRQAGEGRIIRESSDDQQASNQTTKKAGDLSAFQWGPRWVPIRQRLYLRPPLLQLRSHRGAR